MQYQPIHNGAGQHTAALAASGISLTSSSLSIAGKDAVTIEQVTFYRPHDLKLANAVVPVGNGTLIGVNDDYPLTRADIAVTHHDMAWWDERVTHFMIMRRGPGSQRHPMIMRGPLRSYRHPVRSRRAPRIAAGYGPRSGGRAGLGGQ